MGFLTEKQGSLEYLTCREIAVPHCFSTRFGGVSEGYLSSLNLGMHRGDDPDNVRENYRILGAAVGFTPADTVFAVQKHTNLVAQVTRNNRGRAYSVRHLGPETVSLPMKKGCPDHILGRLHACFVL